MVRHFIFSISNGGEGTCKQISIKYGNTPQHYNRHAINIAKAIHNEIDCKLYLNKDNKNHLLAYPVLWKRVKKVVIKENLFGS